MTQADARCTIVRKCASGGTQTTHAYLRDGDARDYIERRQPYPVLDEVTESELLEVELDALRADGVRVTDHFISERITVAVSHYLDDGVWLIVLNPDAGPRRRRAGLHKAQSVIEAAADHRWLVEPPDPGHLEPWKRFVFLGRTSDDDGLTQLARS